MFVASSGNRAGISETDNASRPARGCQDVQLAHETPQPLYSEHTTQHSMYGQHPCSSPLLQNLQSQQLDSVARQQQVPQTAIDQFDWMEYRILDALLAEKYPVEQLSDASHTTSPFNAAPAATAYFSSEANSKIPFVVHQSLSSYLENQNYDSALLQISHPQQQQNSFCVPMPFGDVYTKGGQTALLQSQPSAAAAAAAAAVHRNQQQRFAASDTAAGQISSSNSSSDPWHLQKQATCGNPLCPATAAEADSSRLLSSQQTLFQHLQMTAKPGAAAAAAVDMPFEAVAASGVQSMVPADTPDPWATMIVPGSSKTAVAAAAAAAAAGINMKTTHNVVPSGTILGTALPRDGSANHDHWTAAVVGNLRHNVMYGSPVDMTAAILADNDQPAPANPSSDIHSSRLAESCAVAGPNNAAAAVAAGPPVAAAAAGASTVQIPDSGELVASYAAKVDVGGGNSGGMNGSSPAKRSPMSPAKKPPMSSHAKSLLLPRSRINSSPGSPAGIPPSRVCKKERNSHYQRVCRQRQHKELLDLKTQVANLTSQNSANRDRVQDLLRAQSQLLDRLRDLTVQWQATISSNDALRRENAKFEKQIMAFQQEMLRHSL